MRFSPRGWSYRFFVLPVVAVVVAIAMTASATGAEATRILAAQRVLYDALFVDKYEWCNDAMLRIDDNLYEMGDAAASGGVNSAGEDFSIDVLEWLDEYILVLDHPGPGGEPALSYIGTLRARLYNSRGDVIVIATFISHELPDASRLNRLVVTRCLPGSFPGDKVAAKWAWGPIGAVAVASLACYNNTQLCIADTLTAESDCLRGCNQLSDLEDQVDCRRCCETKAMQDILNCHMSCGANGPDGDYDNCWIGME